MLLAKPIKLRYSASMWDVSFFWYKLRSLCVTSCWCQTGWSEYFKNCWSTGIFTAQPSVGFTENGPKKRKYPVVWTKMPCWCQRSEEMNIDDTKFYRLLGIFALSLYKKSPFCFKEDKNSSGFGTIWGRVNDDRIFIVGRTISLMSYFFKTYTQSASEMFQWGHFSPKASCNLIPSHFHVLKKCL